MSKKPIWREYGEAILIAFILAMIIRFFAVQAYQIPSGSMLDTLLIGDRLLVNKLSYNVKVPFTDKVIFRTGDPQHGDIVVFTYPDTDPNNPRVDYIKRVIGLPGDVLEMRNNVLFRNGERVEEPYTRYIYEPNANFAGYVSPDFFVRGHNSSFEALTVPEDMYFVMGDNRDDSKDSRYWGFASRDSLHGKAWRIYWSWGNKQGDAGSSDFPQTGPRWGRIGRLVE